MNTTKPTLSPIVPTDHPQHHMTWTPTEIKWITAYAERAVDEAVTTLHNKWLMAQVTASAGVSKEHIQQPQGLAHRPMDTAPRDGTIVRLLVQFEDCPLEDDNTRPLWTIGGNSFENTGEDLWQFAGWCWTQDKFTDGVGTPVGWLPLVDEVDVQQPTESWIVVKEHAWDLGDGARPVLVYLWPADFNRELFPSFAAARDFIHDPKHPLPVGWVALQLKSSPLEQPADPEVIHVKPADVRPPDRAEQDKARSDAIFVGYGITVDGQRVSPDRVSFIKQPRGNHDH